MASNNSRFRSAGEGAVIPEYRSRTGATYRVKSEAYGSGLLHHRHVTPSEIRFICKEANCLDLAEAGLFGDWNEILNYYDGGDSRPSAELLATVPAKALAEAWNVSVRTVRTWR